jgi:hypothetical protein
MMEDDVAYSPSNELFPGKLFNKPTPAGTAGEDVYRGCDITYRGPMVTAQLFLDVLIGNSTDPTRTKVLQSGPNDLVFVNFIDHGGGKIVEFPNGPYLHASDLTAALATMRDRKMYDKLVFYMEACNGGSMFEGLLNSTENVFATTAASPTQPSWVVGDLLPSARHSGRGQPQHVPGGFVLSELDGGFRHCAGDGAYAGRAGMQHALSCAIMHCNYHALSYTIHCNYHALSCAIMRYHALQLSCTHGGILALSVPAC